MNEISRVSIAFLEDLGYGVDYTQADDYELINFITTPTITESPKPTPTITKTIYNSLVGVYTDSSGNATVTNNQLSVIQQAVNKSTLPARAIFVNLPNIPARTLARSRRPVIARVEDLYNRATPYMRGNANGAISSSSSSSGGRVDAERRWEGPTPWHTAHNSRCRAPHGTARCF